MRLIVVLIVRVPYRIVKTSDEAKCRALDSDSGAYISLAQGALNVNRAVAQKLLGFYSQTRTLVGKDLKSAPQSSPGKLIRFRRRVVLFSKESLQRSEPVPPA